MEETDADRGEGGWKKVKASANEHICITHSYRQQCGGGQREGGARAGWRWAKEGKMGTYVIVSTIKIKLK